MGNLFKCFGGSCSENLENEYIHTIMEESFVESKIILKIMNMNYEDYVGGYAFSSIEDFLSKYEFYFKNIQDLREYLPCIDRTVKSEKKICVNVEGVFTILGSLINPVVLFRESRKNKDRLVKALSLIEDFLKIYIRDLKSAGVELISFAEPSGNYDIVGPSVFKSIIAPFSIKIINFIIDEENLSVHLCGRLSTALEKEGYISVNKIVLNEEAEYAKGICNLIKEKPFIIGHACTKMFNIKRKMILGINIK